MVKDNQHDKNYKSVLSKKRNFMSFLRQFVKKDWVKKVDEDSLMLCDKGFVDPFFDELESDIIYKVKIADTEVYFYVLLELQSTVDQTMPFRVFYYIAVILRRVFKDAMKKEREKAGFKLPVVIPIVFYSGEASWTPKMDFSEYQLGSEYFENFVKFNYILVDINKLTPEELFADLNAVSAIIAADKVRDTSEALFATIAKVLKSNVWESDSDGLEDFLFWVVNTLKRAPVAEEEIKKILDGIKKGDAVMAKYGIDYIGERYMADGFLKAALRLVEKGKSIQEVTDLLDLSDEQVEQLKIAATPQTAV